MRLPSPLARFFAWLEPPGSRLPFEAPPGVGAVDLRVVAPLVPAAVFAFLVLAAPFALAPGSTGDLTGAVGVVDNGGTWGAFAQPFQWVYQLGDVACHTKASRSFALNDNQMAFCARDVAIFVGLAAGLFVCAPARGRAYRAVVLLPWWSYLALLVPIALDGGMQDVFGFESENWRRVATGVPAGLAIAFALVFIAYESHFASAASRRARLARRLKRAAAQGAGAGGVGESMAAVGSNAVDSAPTEKNATLRP